MADHYEVHLIHPINLPRETSYAVGRNGNSGEVTKLHFEVGAAGWTMETSAKAMAFSNADTNVIIPDTNVALVEVWED